MHLLNSYLNFVKYRIEPKSPDKKKTSAEILRVPSIFSEIIYPVTLFIEIITDIIKQTKIKIIKNIFPAVRCLLVIKNSKETTLNRLTYIKKQYKERNCINIMEGQYQSAEEQYFVDVNTRLKDIEERQRLLKDRLLLVGKNLIEDRDSMFSELQDMKKMNIKMKEDSLKIQEFLKKVADQLAETARKEEVLMIQRQLDLFMSGHGKK